MARIWPDSYFEPTESAWMIAHKFGHLNLVSGGQLEKALRGPRSAGRSRLRLWQRIAYDREAGDRRQAESDVLRAYTREEVFSRHAERASARYVRYCSSCLKGWYHATVFQFLCMQSCPVHGEPLRERCRSCGAQWTFDFEPYEYKLPLHCYQCGQPLAGRWPRFVDLFPARQPAALSFGSIENRLRDTCSRASVDMVLPDDVDPALYANVLCAGATWPTCMNQLKMRLLPLHEARADPRYELEDFRTAARQVRSIGRHLERLFPTCQCHRSTQHRWETVSEGRSSLKCVFLLVPFNGCVRCWTLTAWRWQFMAIFSVVRDPEHFCAFFNRRRPLVNESLNSDLSNIASIALASFGWCALAVERLARTLSTPHLRERPSGANYAEGLMVWCGGSVLRRVYRSMTNRPFVQICYVPPSDAANTLDSIQDWYTSELLTRYRPTRWGESLFNLMYRPRDYVDGVYAWGWEDRSSS